MLKIERKIGMLNEKLVKTLLTMFVLPHDFHLSTSYGLCFIAFPLRVTCHSEIWGHQQKRHELVAFSHRV